MLHVTVNYTEECNVLCDYSKNTRANDLTKKAAIALERKKGRTAKFKLIAPEMNFIFQKAVSTANVKKLKNVTLKMHPQTRKGMYMELIP